MCTYLDTFWCLFKDQLEVFLHYTLQKLTCYKLQFMTENCYNIYKINCILVVSLYCTMCQYIRFLQDTYFSILC